MLNPLGTKGKIAEAFASIVHEMWRGEHTYLSPGSFRVRLHVILIIAVTYQSSSGLYVNTLPNLLERISMTPKSFLAHCWMDCTRISTGFYQNQPNQR